MIMSGVAYYPFGRKSLKPGQQFPSKKALFTILRLMRFRNTNLLGIYSQLF